MAVNNSYIARQFYVYIEFNLADGIVDWLLTDIVHCMYNIYIYAYVHIQLVVLHDMADLDQFVW